MQFFLAASLLAVLSTALLLYQFWSEALTDAGVAPAEEPAADLEPAATLRAA